MKKPSDHAPDELEERRARVLGLGERSARKSHYPELRARLSELERFRAALDGSHDAILLVELAGGRLVDANETASRMLRSPRSELIGRPLVELLPALAAPLTRAAELADGHRETLETTLRAAGGGDALVEVTLSVVCIDGARYAIGVAVDITARAEARRRIAALAAERGRLLEEAQRALRARDVFLTVASHELKTPLMPLQLNLQIVRRELSAHSGGEPLVERLDVALRQVDRLTRQVEAMLDVARAESDRLPLHLVATDVAMVVRGVAARLEAEATRARCVFELHAESPAIAEVDPDRIEHVIENLLTNAIRYGPGGSIMVQVSARPGRVRVTVEDHGIGVAPEDQERIFGLFERAVSERRYGGLGLGLYISRRIVEAHGGRISCTSAPGAGARFEVELPVTGGE